MSIKGKLVYKGGPGSGHHGHRGLPGKHGGSTPGGGGSGGGGGGLPKSKSGKILVTRNEARTFLKAVSGKPLAFVDRKAGTVFPKLNDKGKKLFGAVANSAKFPEDIRDQARKLLSTTDDVSLGIDADKLAGRVVDFYLRNMDYD